MQRLLLAIIILEIPMQVDVYLFYQEAEGSHGSVGGLILSITSTCLAVLYALWFLERWRQARQHDRPAIRVSFPASCYLAVVALSALVANDWRLAVFDACLLGQAFLLYLYISNRVRTSKDVAFLVTMVGVALLMESAIMIGTWCAGRDISIWVVHARDLGSRTSGTMAGPNMAASYLVLLLAPVASILLTPLDRRYKVLALASVSLGTFALIMTGSRGAWIAFFISGLIFLSLNWRRGWMPKWVLSSVAIGAVVVLGLSHQLIANRVFGDDRGAAISRIPLIQMGLQIVRDHPVMGVGAGNCYPAMLAEAGAAAYRTEWLSTIHNKYLLVAVETGILGLIFFLWFLGVTVRQGWAGWSFRDPTLSPIALALTAVILGHMVHMLVDRFNNRPQVEMLWCCAGLVAAISYMNQHAEPTIVEQSGE